MWLGTFEMMAQVKESSWHPEGRFILPSASIRVFVAKASAAEWQSQWVAVDAWLLTRNEDAANINKVAVQRNASG